MVCPACLAIPFMIAGTGTGFIGKSAGMMWIIVISIILTLVGLYLFFFKKDCGTAKCSL